MADEFMVTLDESSPEGVDAALDAMVAKRLRRPSRSRNSSTNSPPRSQNSPIA